MHQNIETGRLDSWELQTRAEEFVIINSMLVRYLIFFELLSSCIKWCKRNKIVRGLDELKKKKSGLVHAMWSNGPHPQVGVTKDGSGRTPTRSTRSQRLFGSHMTFLHFQKIRQIKIILHVNPGPKTIGVTRYCRIEKVQ